MTVERSTIVLVARGDWEVCAPLAARAEIAARRHDKALPGDRKDAVAFEQLADQIERIGLRLLREGRARGIRSVEPVAATKCTWVSAVTDLSDAARAHQDLRTHVASGGALIELHDPFVTGDLPPLAVATGPSAPAQPWRAPEHLRDWPQVALWESQLKAAAHGSREPLLPSTITNRVLTQGLRRFVAGDGPAVLARVVYQDGSEAQPFPLRCLDVVDRDEDPDAIRLALMSMRHNEMDDIVDGCLLRNRLMSRVRPAAETDDLAYSLARHRLQELATRSVTVRLYQTGFQPAVVGFYRALVDHLIESPGIAVWPHFHRYGATFTPGLVWAVR